MFDCTRVEEAEPEFGVVLIERGHEVGGADDRFGTGTLARIVEAAELPDGRWVLNAVGTRRVVVGEWRPDDPYPVAMVDEVDEAALVPGRQRASGRRRTAGPPGPGPGRRARPARPSRPRCSWPTTPPWPPGSSSPSPPSASSTASACLEAPDHGSRLRILAGLTEEEITVLAYRLGRG